MKVSVQRYCAKNDGNGNPRRVFVIRNDEGTIIATADEGYYGRRAVTMKLDEIGASREYTDLGDIDVSPGVYRRLANYRV